MCCKPHSALLSPIDCLCESCFALLSLTSHVFLPCSFLSCACLLLPSVLPSASCWLVCFPMPPAGFYASLCLLLACMLPYASCWLASLPLSCDALRASLCLAVSCVPPSGLRCLACLTLPPAAVLASSLKLRASCL